MSQRYPIGQQDFKSIREENKVYVDKTEIIYHLTNANKYVFLSRPRRFGKSLLLSTIKAYFQGRKQLFEGLAIEKLEKEWPEHPILHLELSGIESFNTESLENRLIQQFRQWEKTYDIENSISSLGSRFADIIIGAYKKTGKKVVILVDEYDNPLINTLHRKEIFEQNRDLLKSIYSSLKALDEFIRFGMLTGVSRFSKTSIFSGLNNLRDISFFDDYAAICGFTEAEIRKFLWPGVEKLGEKNDRSPEQALLMLKEAYDGYHFSESCPDIYNPFSLLNALADSKISNYWISTATPTFLIEKIKKSTIPLSKIFKDNTTEETLAEQDTAFSSPVSLLYQTGYLTIKGFDKETQRYSLDVPNREVESSIFKSLLGAFIGMDNQTAADAAHEMRQYLIEGAIGEFLEYLKSFLAEQGYDIIPQVSEKYFQNTMYLIFRVMGLDVVAEKRTSFGRSDIIVFTDSYIYIFELKLNGSAMKALEQLERKGYDKPYLKDGRKIIKVGINFSSLTRNIDEWQIA